MSPVHAVVCAATTYSTTVCFICETDSVQDADGNWYKTVLIGTQCWMAENLNVGIKIAPGVTQTNNGTIEKYCHGGINGDTIQGDCSVWGGLYLWDEMMQYVTTPGIQGISPSGWHIPSDVEWMTMEEALGMCTGTGAGCSGANGFRGTDEGDQLKTFADCFGGSNCANSGFEALLAGFRGSDGVFYNSVSDALLWSSTQDGGPNAFSRTLLVNVASVGRGANNKQSGFIVRCVKDCSIPATPDTINGSTNVNGGQTGISYSISPVPGAISYTWTVPPGATITSGLGTVSITVGFGSASGNICVTASDSCATSSASCLLVTVFTCGTDPVQDADGNWYNTVLIGTQCWLKENMRTTKYPDSSAITKGAVTHGDASWGTDQAWYSCPPNTSNNGEDCLAPASLGMLYQWSAAMDGSVTEGAQGVCPTGWHVPTDAEWCTLENTIEPGTDASCNTTGFRGISTGSKMADNVADQSWTAGTLTGGTGFGSSGLAAGPSGFRGINGFYNARSIDTYVWSSTGSGSNAWKRYLSYTDTQVLRNTVSKAYGFSVRCIKDCPLPATPATINGSSKVDTGQTGVAYSIDTVSGASSYTWTVPPGAVITSGQGTDSITVDFATLFGSVCVTANNSCGPSALSCLSVSVFTCGTDSVQDVEGNWYQTVQIGGQCWFQENLRTTKYPNGSAITKGPSAHGAAGWTVDSAYYSCPPNAANNGEDCLAAALLGMAYQWSAVMGGDTIEGAQGVCPTSWHVPTDADWCTMENTIEAGTDASCNLTGYRGTSTGSSMANDGTGAVWIAGNLRTHANFGTSGLDIVPSGYRDVNGQYLARTNGTYSWTSSESGTDAIRRYLNYSFRGVFRGPIGKPYCFTVRCVKN